MKNRTPLQNACADALAVQDASNLSGIILAWGRHQQAIKDACGGNNEAYHHHPVNLLFISKITSLMRVNADCIGGVRTDLCDCYAEASKACEEGS